MAVVTTKSGAAPVEPVPARMESPAVAPAPYLVRYVDWSAIFGGAVVAAGVFFVFSVFGSGIGLSLISPTEGNAMPAMGLLIAGALWGLWVQVSSYMAGGYVAGRMRQRVNDATQEEVEMRDGAHGLITWAVGVLLSAWMAGMLAMFAAGAAGSAANSAATAASGNAPDMSYYADRLMRPASGAPAAGTEAQAQNASIASLLTRLAVSPNDDDRAYVTAQIAQRTGVTPQEATQRLDAVTAEIAQAADQARIAGVMLAFFTAVTLIISAVAAWWAAVKGGEHRDQAINHSAYVRWR
jgi:hypothetical protein